MTLSTDLYIHDQIDAKEVFDFCRELIGAPSTYRFIEDDDSIHGQPGQGLDAWLLVYRLPNGPIQPEPEPHDEYCVEDCGYPHTSAHWVRVNFDTAYGYRGPGGESCGQLHAKYVAQLGKWLDARSLRWSWRNEFTGEIHESYSGLGDLGQGAQEATDWFHNAVQPIIDAEAAVQGAEVHWS